LQGLACGVASLSDLQALLVALVFHQFFEGIALGSRLSDASLSPWDEALLGTVFSLAAPLGLAVGVGVSYSLNVNGETFLLVQGTFDGVCAGLLLFLGYSLLLRDFPEDVRRFTSGKDRATAAWRQAGMFAATWLGAGLMAFIGKYL
jgi:zinc transporter 1/2/3